MQPSVVLALKARSGLPSVALAFKHARCGAASPFFVARGLDLRAVQRRSSPSPPSRLWRAHPHAPRAPSSRVVPIERPAAPSSARALPSPPLARASLAIGRPPRPHQLRWCWHRGRAFGMISRGQGTCVQKGTRGDIGCEDARRNDHHEKGVPQIRRDAITRSSASTVLPRHDRPGLETRALRSTRRRRRRCAHAERARTRPSVPAALGRLPPIRS